MALLQEQLTKLKAAVSRLAPQPPNAETPDHSKIRKADPYSYQIGHIRLAGILRISVVLNVVQLIAILVLIGVIESILPLKEVRIALLRADPEDNRVYSVVPINPKADGFKLLLEAKSREFLQKLLTINTVTQREWIAEATNLASPEFGKKFYEERIANKAIQKIIDRGIRRQINIISADHVNSLQPNVWKLVVDFEQIDFKGEQEIDRKKLRAYLAIRTSVENVPESAKYENPLGIQIFDMTVQKRGESQKND